MTSFLAVAAGTWGVIMSLAPLLQIRTIVRNRSSADVSLGYLAILLVGFVLWLAYAVAIGNAPLLVANACNVVANVATIAVVLRFRPDAEDGARPDLVGDPDATGSLA